MLRSAASRDKTWCTCFIRIRFALQLIIGFTEANQILPNIISYAIKFAKNGRVLQIALPMRKSRILEQMSIGKSVPS